MRVALLFFLACAGGSPQTSSSASVCSGDVLFGNPTDATGLSDAECGPTCVCGDEPWTAPTYTEADADALLVWELTVPYAEVLADPYASESPGSDADSVCVMIPQGTTYTLQSSASVDDVDGGILTHYDACGVCSTLADLAVYMRYDDLTDPVRQCGLDNLDGDQEAHMACLIALGFTVPCAEIWYWNTLHTQQECLAECLSGLDDPYNLPDGSINACLACDEAESGPVFKAIAGRTRRNTGLPNAICRPCDEVRPVEHHYGP